MNDARPSFLRRLGRTLKGFVLWSYDRGTWQYDVMVALIVLFVLFAPSRWFHDQPVYNPWQARDIMRLDKEPEGVRYRVSAELLAAYDPDPHRAAGEVFAQNLPHRFHIVRIQEVKDEDAEVVWYDVWVRE
ncbi:MAG TPA: hypothetical protein VNN18_02075 [Candidatus Xenobia bacterium]|nr:hypothetical protein [Candidatus Xenobia bacterium]